MQVHYYNTLAIHYLERESNEAILERQPVIGMAVRSRQMTVLHATMKEERDSKKLSAAAALFPK